MGGRSRPGTRRLALLACGVLVGCAAAPKSDPVLQVHNRSKYSITSIQMNRCGDDPGAARELLRRDIDPSGSRNIALPPSCVDLVAINSRGQVAGEQRGLRMLPGASWTIH